MLTEQEQGELSNLALEMAPGQDMRHASVIYRVLCAEFEGEKNDWFWEERSWMWFVRDDDKPPLGSHKAPRKGLPVGTQRWVGEEGA